MTVINDTTRVTVTGNSATTVFNYDFIIPSQSDAQLWLVDTSVTPNTQALVLSSAWSMTGAGNPNGGTFTYPLVGSPIDSDHQLVLERTVPYTQPFAFRNQGPYYPTNVESALDWLEYQIQQLVRGLSQTIQISLGSGATIVPVPNTFFYFDDNGDLTLITVAELIQLLIDGGLIQALIDAGLVNALIVDGDLINELINNGLVTALTPYFGGGGAGGAYDLAFDFGQTNPDAGARLVIAIPRDVEFAADFSGSQASSGAAPVSDAVFAVYKGHGGTDTQIGTVTVDNTNTVTYATTGGVAQTVVSSVDNYVYIDAPDPQVTDLEGVSITLKGSLV